MRRTKNWIVERIDRQWRVTVQGKDAAGVEHAPTAPRNPSLVNLQIVRDWVRSTYQYDGADPLTVAAIEEVTEAGPHGEQAGDFTVSDEVTGHIVRVVDGAVLSIWKNW